MELYIRGKKTMNMTQPLLQRITAGIIVLYLLVIPAFSCSNGGLAGSPSVSTVAKDNIEAALSINGRMDMPREVKLHFLTPGMVEKIFVSDGEKVKTGKLLAKLDDTAQMIAVSQAQYSIEIAMNELVEKPHVAILGFPSYYPSSATILRLEQAQNEVAEARILLHSEKYRESMARIRTAVYDLNGCLELLNPPTQINLDDYPNIQNAIALLKRDINMLEQNQYPPFGVQGLMERGNYAAASIQLETMQHRFLETYSAVNGICGIIKSYFPPYPDTATTLDVMKQIDESLQRLQQRVEQGDYDTVALAETIRGARHDLETGNTILDENQLLLKHGINLKLLMLNNFNLQKAYQGLEFAKAELMKTEVLAPFDGTVVEIGVKENDVLSAVDYNSKTIIHLVDTDTVEMVATVDETDIGKLVVGQTAIITTDTIPGEKFTGTLSFVSPYGSTAMGPATFTVKIKVDNTAKLLKRGVSAVATIPVANKNNVLLVPSNALKGSHSNYRVDVVKTMKEGEISETEKRAVTVGLRNKDFVEITSGLNEGDMVLVYTLHQ
jgi:RND family efflux transporter MFP subunit